MKSITFILLLFISVLSKPAVLEYGQTEEFNLKKDGKEYK